MKKWIATIAIIILSWSGSITATELSEKGCYEMLRAHAKLKIMTKNGKKAFELLRLEERKEQCETMEVAMEILGIKENSQEWHEMIKAASDKLDKWLSE